MPTVHCGRPLDQRHDPPLLGTSVVVVLQSSSDALPKQHQLPYKNLLMLLLLVQLLLQDSANAQRTCLPRKLVSRPLVTRSIFHRILQTGLFGNQINTKKQALNISSSRENCAFLHAPSLRLDNSRIRELAIIRRLRLPAHSKRAPACNPGSWRRVSACALSPP
jgi:hypothetical protein